MKIPELIELLESLKAEYGDKEIYGLDHIGGGAISPIQYVEYVEQDDCILIAG